MAGRASRLWASSLFELLLSGHLRPDCTSNRAVRYRSRWHRPSDRRKHAFWCWPAWRYGRPHPARRAGDVVPATPPASGDINRLYGWVDGPATARSPVGPFARAASSLALCARSPRRTFRIRRLLLRILFLLPACVQFLFRRLAPKLDFRYSLMESPRSCPWQPIRAQLAGCAPLRRLLPRPRIW